MGWWARSELRTVAPIFNPPSGRVSILSNGRRLMSSTRAGVSTLSFIKSIKVVPPATNLTSAPCCAVFAFAALAMAAAAFSERLNSKVCMKENSCAQLRAFANLLDCRDDVGVSAAAADVAAHQFLDRSIIRAAGFFEQSHRGHDLPGGAISALISVEGEEGGLHGMH